MRSTLDRLPRAFLAPLLLLAALGLVTGCATGGATAPTAQRAPDSSALSGDTVEITLLQINDVYEITPLDGGRSGGLARVATLRQRLAAENPNLLTLLAGDFFSPSALGTAKVDGEPLAGKQMVAVLNVLGLDLATFGNHEFDLDEKAFRQRLDEVRFPWVAANVANADGTPLPGVEPHKIYTFRGPGGRQVRLGVFGITLTENDPDYVTISDPPTAAAQQVEALDGQVDVLVALTHQALEADIALVEQFPQIDLVIGGHEHENWLARRGVNLAPVAKADANARTVFIHRLIVPSDGRDAKVTSRFVPITDALPDDPVTAAEVQRWVDRGYRGFRDEGFEPEATVADVTDPLDGREVSVRNGTTRLTELIAQSMLHAGQGAEAAFYNGGSIRIDDVLPPGQVTQYDVIRILPFGGHVVTARIRGDVLQRALEAGQASRGSGSFLQTAEIEPSGGSWQVAGRPLDPAATYVVATNDYLAGGRGSALPFLEPGADGFEVIDANGPDVRNALIDELRRQYPPQR